MPRHAPPPVYPSRAWWAELVAAGALGLAAFVAAAHGSAPKVAAAERFTTAPEASEPIAHGGPLAMPSIGWLPSEQTVATTTQNVPVIATSARRTASAPQIHVPTTPSVAPKASQGVSAGPTSEVTTSTPPVAAATSTATDSRSDATSQPPTEPSSDAPATTTAGGPTPSPSASDTQQSPEPSTTPSSGSAAPETTATTSETTGSEPDVTVTAGVTVTTTEEATCSPGC